jgi:hypothetical protein
MSRHVGAAAAVRKEKGVRLGFNPWPEPFPIVLCWNTTSMFLVHLTHLIYPCICTFRSMTACETPSASADPSRPTPSQSIMCMVGFFLAVLHRCSSPLRLLLHAKTMAHLENGGDPDTAAFKLDMHIGVLWQCLAAWFVTSWDTINNHNLILKAWEQCKCAGKHATLHNFCFIFQTLRLLRTLRFPYMEVLSFLGFRPVSDMVPSPLMYLWA